MFSKEYELVLGELADTVAFGLLVGSFAVAQVDGSFLASSLREMNQDNVLESKPTQERLPALTAAIERLSNADALQLITKYKERGSVQWS